MDQIELRTAAEAIDALGGVHVVAEIFAITPEAVWNWRTRGLPPDTYEELGPRLLRAGYWFRPQLFGQRVGKPNGS